MSRNQIEWDRKPALPDSHLLDNRIYTSEALFDEEKEKVFQKVWIFCAHESELPEPGDYRTAHIANNPVVLVRGKDDKVRAFLNICPHRGALIVRKPSGNAKAFTCLFHRWSFDGLGNCVTVPHPKGFEDVGLTKEDFSLRELRCESKHGLIFVNMDDEARPLDHYLGGVMEAVDDVLEEVEFEVFHHHRIIVDTNWKLWTATNVELYHVWLHVLNRATSIQAPGWLDRTLKSYDHGHVAFEKVVIAYDKRNLGKRSTTLPNLGPNESRLAHVFPDLLVNIRASNMRLDKLTPISPTKVMVEFRGLGIKGESAEDRRRRINDHNQFWGPFGRNLPEDSLAAVEQMRALQAEAMPYSLCAREVGDTPAMTDEPMRHFHAEWGRLMGRPASDPFGSRLSAVAAE